MEQNIDIAKALVEFEQLICQKAELTQPDRQRYMRNLQGLHKMKIEWEQLKAEKNGAS